MKAQILLRAPEEKEQQPVLLLLTLRESASYSDRHFSRKISKFLRIFLIYAGPQSNNFIRNN